MFLLPLDLLLPAIVPLDLVPSLQLVGRYVIDVAWRLLLFRIVPLMGVGMPVGMFLFHSAGHQWLNVAFVAFVAGEWLHALVRVSLFRIGLSFRVPAAERRFLEFQMARDFRGRSPRRPGIGSSHTRRCHQSLG